MTDLSFTITEERSGGLPYRSRSLFKDYLSLGSQAEVLIPPRRARELRAAAASAYPRETGGLLAGRAFHDQLGDYTVLLGAVQAPAEACGHGHVHFGPDITAQLRAEIERDYPGGDLIGWWHSHTAVTPFSEVDRRTQQRWTKETQVGLLVFASGTTWAYAYVGPHSRCLKPFSTPSAVPAHRLVEPKRNGRQAPTDSDFVASSVPAVGADAQLSLPGSRPRRHVRAQARRQRVHRTNALIIIGTILLLIAVGAMAGAVFQLERTVESRLPAGSGAPPSVRWACASSSPSTIRCERSAPSSMRFEWVVDGRQVGSAATVSFQPPRSGMHTITLIGYYRSDDLSEGSVRVPTLALAPYPSTTSSTTPTAVGLHRVPWPLPSS